MPKRLTTQDFIKRAQKVHGDLYDYSKVVYKLSREKVVIVCKQHGDFLQRPNGHLDGNGCPECGGTKKTTKNEFTAEARRIHGGKYDYAQVVYKNNITDVIIHCPTHGDFNQAPSDHLSGKGCIGCGRLSSADKRRKTTAEFVAEAKEEHGDRYDYSKVAYKGARKDVTIICRLHGEFQQRAGHHLDGSGCMVCSGSKRKTTVEFIDDARKVHGDRFDYSKVVYQSGKDKIIIICSVHGEFFQTPFGHLKGRGCDACGGSKDKTNEEFILEAWDLHRDRYDYSKTEYENYGTKVTIGCPKHGDFLQEPGKHLDGNGCPVCAQSNNRRTSVYLVRITLNKEVFLKIGITSRPLKTRFAWEIKNRAGFKYEHIKSFTLNHPQKAEQLESELHDKFVEYQHIPEVKFGGWTECFELDALPLLKEAFEIFINSKMA